MMGHWPIIHHMGVSENSGTPKSSILIEFSIINHPFWVYPYFRKHPHKPQQTSQHPYAAATVAASGQDVNLRKKADSCSKVLIESRVFVD